MEDFGFDRVTEADLPMLLEWLHRPHVAEWWQPTPTLEELREEYVDAGSAPLPVYAHIAKLRGEPIGFIQYYVVMGAGGGWWESETDPGARGIDQFLADGARLGQGLGRGMIKAFLAKLFEDPAVTTVQTDPNPDNLRAVRAYTRSGFRPTGVVDTPDGPALLMHCTRQTLEEERR